MFAGLALGSFAARQAGAAELMACGPDLPPSRMTFYSAKSDLIVETVTDQQLARLNGDLRGHAGDGFFLADPAVRGWFNIQHRVLPSATVPALFCNAPERVDVALGYASRRILVTPERIKDRCVMGALREHQSDHMALENHELDLFIDEQTPALGNGMKNLKAAAAPSADSAQKQFEAAGLPILRNLEHRLQLLKEALRRQIDTSERMAKLGRSCDGRVGQFWDGRKDAI